MNTIQAYGLNTLAAPAAKTNSTTTQACRPLVGQEE